MNMEKQKTKVYDFKKVSMEVEIGVFQELDLRRPFGNAIHQNTDDIGIDEVARRIFKEDTVEISDEEVKVLLLILKTCRLKLVIAAKQALIKVLEGK